MKLFTEDDFKNLEYHQNTRPSYAYAEFANEKLSKLLQDATVVYCDKDELHFSGVDEIGYTHKGYLIGVEDLPKKECNHEPKEVVVNIKDTMVQATFSYSPTAICKHCGVQLVANWKDKK